MEERQKDDNYQLKDEDIIYNDDFELNKNDNLDYYVTNINKTVKHDNYDNNVYNQLLMAKILIPNTEGDGHICSTVLWRATNSMNEPIGRQ